VPMVAMGSLLSSFGPRPSRPRWRSAGRGRPDPHAPQRAGAPAEDGDRRLVCRARKAAPAAGERSR